MKLYCNYTLRPVTRFIVIGGSILLVASLENR